MLKMASTLKESGLVRTAMESLPKVLRDVPGLSLSYLRPEHLPGGAKSRSFRTVQCLMGRASATPLFIEEPVEPAKPVEPGRSAKRASRCSAPRL